MKQPNVITANGKEYLGYIMQELSGVDYLVIQGIALDISVRQAMINYIKCNHLGLLDTVKIYNITATEQTLTTDEIAIWEKLHNEFEKAQTLSHEFITIAAFDYLLGK